MVLYDVTHKNCVLGPLFACRVSPRHAFSGKIADIIDITMSGRHVADMSATFPAKVVVLEVLAGLSCDVGVSTICDCGRFAT